MKRYAQNINDKAQMVEAPFGGWVRWTDVEELLNRLPEGMKHCTFRVKECEKGHNRLHAANWIDHGCPTCAQAKLQKELMEMTAKALAAVWLLVQEGVNLTDDLQTLHEEARECLLGKDKQTIAKLHDELRYAQEAYKNAVRPPRPGVNVVYGITDGKYEGMRHALMITSLRHADNGGLEIEVQLP